MAKPFEVIEIPPEILQASEHCEIRGAECQRAPFVLVITEKDSFYVCRTHLWELLQIAGMIEKAAVEEARAVAERYERDRDMGTGQED